MAIANSVGYFFSMDYTELLTAAHLYPEDLDRIEKAIDYSMSEVWARMDHNWADALTLLRARYLVGGKLQSWCRNPEEFGELHVEALPLRA